jgi:hypothetical protein
LKHLKSCSTFIQQHIKAETLVWIFFTVLVLWIGLTYQLHGISNDEFVQHTYGQLLLKYYLTDFVDDAALHYKNLYLYGGLFDLIAASLEKVSTMWIWDLRHLISAGFGLLGFVALYRTAYLLGGARLGLVALLMLALTSVWTGAMFTHTKDIPFASCMLWTLYATIIVVRDLDQTAWRHVVLLGIAVGSALGLRIGGAFAVVYLLLLLIIRFAHLYLHQPSNWLPRLYKTTYKLLMAALIAFVLMAFCWPWGVTAPNHIYEAVGAFSHFAFNMETMLHGHVYEIGDVPRSYLFQYLAVKLPEVVLMGLVGFVGVLLMFRKRFSNLNTSQAVALLSITLSLAIPLLFVLYDKPALYNGVRHFTFVVPLIILLAAWGFCSFLSALSQLNNALMARVLTGVWVLLAVGLAIINIRDIKALYPYDYMRLNSLVSHEPNAQYQWEGDYWSSALREASPSLTALNLPKRDKPYLVAVCAETEQGQAYLDNRFEVTKDWVAADFYISGTNMHCHEVLAGKVIGSVYRNGMLLAVVKDRRQLVGDERITHDEQN